MHEYYLDLYYRTFYIGIGITKERWNTMLSERLGVPVEMDTENAQGSTDMIAGKDLTAIVIHFPEAPSADVITHEAIHAANFVYKKCGILHDVDNDEPFAYLAGWIAKKITEAVNG